MVSKTFKLLLLPLCCAGFVVLFGMGLKPNCEAKDVYLFRKDMNGTLEQVKDKCSPIQAKALNNYAQSFKWIGRRIKPYAAKLTLEEQWNVESNSTAAGLSHWMKQRTKILKRVFHVLESAPIVPSGCDVDTRALAFKREPNTAADDHLYIGFMIIRSVQNTRHIVALSPLPISGLGPSSSLDDPTRYDIQYTTAHSAYSNEKNASLPLTDELVITSHFTNQGLPYDLQISWNVPPMVSKNKELEKQYLRKYCTGFFYYDLDKGKTARFARFTEQGPLPKPLINW